MTRSLSDKFLKMWTLAVLNHVIFPFMGTFCTFFPKLKNIKNTTSTLRGKFSYSMFGINFNFFINSFYWDLFITWLHAMDKNKFAFFYALHALSFAGVIAWALKHKVSTWTCVESLLWGSLEERSNIFNHSSKVLHSQTCQIQYKP